MGLYAKWLTENSTVADKFGADTYPTVLFIADNRTFNSSSEFNAIRITTGPALPSNGGLGFTMATPNPLMCGATTTAQIRPISAQHNPTPPEPCQPPDERRDHSPLQKLERQISAVFPLKPPRHQHNAQRRLDPGLVDLYFLDDYSGGIMNLTRLLEDWGNNSPSIVLTFNTSIMMLYESQQVRMHFKILAALLLCPYRKFSYDIRYSDLPTQPPACPHRMPVRFTLQ